MYGPGFRLSKSNLAMNTRLLQLHIKPQKKVQSSTVTTPTLTSPTSSVGGASSSTVVLREVAKPVPKEHQGQEEPDGGLELASPGTGGGLEDGRKSPPDSGIAATPKLHPAKSFEYPRAAGPSLPPSFTARGSGGSAVRAGSSTPSRGARNKKQMQSLGYATGGFALSPADCATMNEKIGRLAMVGSTVGSEPHHLQFGANPIRQRAHVAVDLVPTVIPWTDDSVQCGERMLKTYEEVWRCVPRELRQLKETWSPRDLCVAVQSGFALVKVKSLSVADLKRKVLESAGHYFVKGKARVDGDGDAPVQWVNHYSVVDSFRGVVLDNRGHVVFFDQDKDTASDVAAAAVWRLAAFRVEAAWLLHERGASNHGHKRARNL